MRVVERETEGTSMYVCAHACLYPHVFNSSYIDKCVCVCAWLCVCVCVCVTRLLCRLPVPAGTTLRWWRTMTMVAMERTLWMSTSRHCTRSTATNRGKKRPQRHCPAQNPPWDRGPPPHWDRAPTPVAVHALTLAGGNVSFFPTMLSPFPVSPSPSFLLTVFLSEGKKKLDAFPQAPPLACSSPPDVCVRLPVVWVCFHYSGRSARVADAAAGSPARRSTSCGSVLDTDGRRCMSMGAFFLSVFIHFFIF